MSVLVILFCIFLILWIVRRHRYLQQWDHFPGYKGWQALPVVGHAYLLGGQPIRELLELQKKFGDTFRLDVGNTPTIILGNYQDGADAFKSEVQSRVEFNYFMLIA